MPRRGTALATLDRLLRIEPDGVDRLGLFVVEHFDELAGPLHLDDCDTRSLRERSDGELRPKLISRLGRAVDAAARDRAMRLRVTAENAAIELGRTARFLDDAIEIEPTVILGDLLADARAKYIELHLDGDTIVRLPRGKLVDAGRALRVFPDLRCTVDGRSLTLRWRRGVGRITLQSLIRHGLHADDVIVVPLLRPRPMAIARVTSRPRRSGWSTAFADAIGLQV